MYHEWKICPRLHSTDKKEYKGNNDLFCCLNVLYWNAILKYWVQHSVPVGLISPRLLFQIWLLEGLKWCVVHMAATGQRSDPGMVAPFYQQVMGFNKCVQCQCDQWEWRIGRKLSRRAFLSLQSEHKTKRGIPFSATYGAGAVILRHWEQIF